MCIHKLFKKNRKYTFDIERVLPVYFLKPYFSLKPILLFVFVDEAPIIASKSPGSDVHVCFTSSKKLRAVLSIVNESVLVSPGCKVSFPKSLSSFTGRGNDDFRSAM